MVSNEPSKKTVIISRLLLVPSFRVNTAPFADAKVPFGFLYDLFVVFILFSKEYSFKYANDAASAAYSTCVCRHLRYLL